MEEARPSVGALAGAERVLELGEDVRAQVPALDADIDSDVQGDVARLRDVQPVPDATVALQAPFHRFAEVGRNVLATQRIETDVRLVPAPRPHEVCGRTLQLHGEVTGREVGVVLPQSRRGRGRGGSRQAPGDGRGRALQGSFPPVPASGLRGRSDSPSSRPAACTTYAIASAPTLPTGPLPIR